MVIYQFILLKVPIEDAYKLNLPPESRKRTPVEIFLKPELQKVKVLIEDAYKLNLSPEDLQKTASVEIFLKPELQKVTASYQYNRCCCHKTCSLTKMSNIRKYILKSTKICCQLQQQQMLIWRYFSPLVSMCVL